MPYLLVFNSINHSVFSWSIKLACLKISIHFHKPDVAKSRRQTNALKYESVVQITDVKRQFTHTHTYVCMPLVVSHTTHTHPTPYAFHFTHHIYTYIRFTLPLYTFKCTHTHHPYNFEYFFFGIYRYSSCTTKQHHTHTKPIARSHCKFSCKYVTSVI